MLAGTQQGSVESLGADGAAWRPDTSRRCGGLGAPCRLDELRELIALPDEVAALVAIDGAGAGGAVAMHKGDGPLELVVGFVLRRAHTQQRAQLDHKALLAGQLGGGRTLPAGNEVGGGRVVGTSDGRGVGQHGRG